jgi:hypothetical protein
MPSSQRPKLPAPRKVTREQERKYLQWEATRTRTLQELSALGMLGSILAEHSRWRRASPAYRRTHLPPQDRRR